MYQIQKIHDFLLIKAEHDFPSCRSIEGAGKLALNLYLLKNQKLCYYGI